MTTVGAGTASMVMGGFMVGPTPIGAMAGTIPITVGAGVGTTPGGTIDGAGRAITLHGTVTAVGDIQGITAIGTVPITATMAGTMPICPEEGDTTTIT